MTLKTTRQQRQRHAGRAGGVTGKGFVPGQSGNPGGRPKGLAALVRERVGGDGAPLFDGLRLIALGPPKERDLFFGERVKVTTRDRLSALQELADRGWGRPMQAIDVGDPQQPVTIRFVDVDVSENRAGR